MDTNTTYFGYVSNHIFIYWVQFAKYMPLNHITTLLSRSYLEERFEFSVGNIKFKPPLLIFVGGPDFSGSVPGSEGNVLGISGTVVKSVTPIFILEFVF